MNMKLLAVVTSPSIYHDWSNHKKFWEENLTGEEKFTLGEFTAANMKRVHELELLDGRVEKYAVNIIIENLIDQVDDQGWDTGILQ